MENEEQEATNEPEATNEQVAAVSKGGPKYPRTMKSGRLKGRTFNSDAEYKAATDEAHANGVPKRRYRKAPKAQPVVEQGTFRLQVDLNGQQTVIEGPMTQKQLIDVMLLFAEGA